MLKHLLFRYLYTIRRTLRISSYLFATHTHFPLYPPSSGNMRFYSGAPPLEIRFYVFTRYFTPEMGAILLVNEGLKVVHKYAITHSLRPKYTATPPLLRCHTVASTDLFTFMVLQQLRVLQSNLKKRWRTKLCRWSYLYLKVVCLTFFCLDFLKVTEKYCNGALTRMRWNALIQRMAEEESGAW